MELKKYKELPGTGTYFLSLTSIMLVIKVIFLNDPAESTKFMYSCQCCGSGINIPDPKFLPNPKPGSRGQKGTGGRTRIRNTDRYFYKVW
jgi:hypothetical protein